jgi:hypothetical protein
MKQRVDQCSPISLVIRSARSGVDHHAGWFVDHCEIIVLVNDVERDLLRNGPQSRARDFAKYFNYFGALQTERGPLWFAIYRHLRLRDELLHPRAAGFWKLRDQKLVKALARVLRRDGEACSI